MMTPARVQVVSREECIDPVELRRVCEVEGLMPPSTSEAAQCLDAWSRCDPRWARVFLLLARVDRQEYLNGLHSRLAGFAPEDRDVIGDVAYSALVESPCGPPPLVLAWRDGSVVVADLAGGAWHRFDAGTGARWSRLAGPCGEHRCAPRPARRPWWRWWR